MVMLRSSTETSSTTETSSSTAISLRLCCGIEENGNCAEHRFTTAEKTHCQFEHSILNLVNCSDFKHTVVMCYQFFMLQMFLYEKMKLLHMKKYYIQRPQT